RSARRSSREPRAVAARGRNGMVRRQRAADLRQSGRTRGSRRARAAARADPNQTNAEVRRNATTNPGTEAPIAYDGVGRWWSVRVQKPRSVGWYSHSYAMKPASQATMGPGRNEALPKIRFSE